MQFYKEKDLALCGLACVLCSVEDCPGCKARGCKKGSDCSVYQCVMKKELSGCYECDEFPCDEKMLQGIRNKAFNLYAKQYGKQALLDRLKINFENGIVYHEADGLKGDYDKCKTEQEVIELLKNGKPDPYDKCPEYESRSFLLRLVSMDDADDLFLCYNDPEAQKIFNSDNCTSDFKFSTLEHMKAYMEGWLNAYKNREFIRYSIIDKSNHKAIGTIEIFGGELGEERSEYGVLRIDVKSEYENEEALTELINISDSFFYDVNTERFITKAIPEATQRIGALTLNGYVPTIIGDGGNREHYYMKRSPQNGN